MGSGPFSIACLILIFAPSSDSTYFVSIARHL